MIDIGHDFVENSVRIIHTGLDERPGLRLRELAPPSSRGSQEAGFTQPRAHSFAQLYAITGEIVPGYRVKEGLSCVLFLENTKLSP